MTNNKEKAYLFRIKFSLYSPIELDRKNPPTSSAQGCQQAKARLTLPLLACFSERASGQSFVVQIKSQTTRSRLTYSDSKNVFRRIT